MCTGWHIMVVCHFVCIAILSKIVRLSLHIDYAITLCKAIGLFRNLN
jgi:hypothetical protein